MNDLIYSISSELDQVATPECATDYGERVKQIILAKTPIPADGNVPTADEIAQSFDESTCTLFNHIINGHRIKLSETEIDLGVKNWFDPVYRIEGRIRLVSETVARVCERLDRYVNLYAYFTTDKNYCFGPYYCTPNFSEILYDGKGSPVAIRFYLDYFGGGIDHSLYIGDEDIEEAVTMTVDRTDITVDSTVITADQI